MEITDVFKVSLKGICNFKKYLYALCTVLNLTTKNDAIDPIKNILGTKKQKLI